MQLKDFKEQNKKDSIQQKQKELDNEKKLYPVFNPKNLAIDTKPNEASTAIPEAISVVVPTSTTTKIIRKTKHRSNTLEHKIANKVELND